MKRLFLRFRLPLIDSVSTLTACLLTVNKILLFFMHGRFSPSLHLPGIFAGNLTGCGWFQPGWTRVHSGGLGSISGPGGGLATNHSIRGRDWAAGPGWCGPG